jgi:DNA-binding NarL/FixJ family response regulator
VAQRLAVGCRPDVLLLDLRMPGEPPLETMAGVKASSPETAVLILTAHNRDAYLAAVLAAVTVLEAYTTRPKRNSSM